MSKNLIPPTPTQAEYTAHKAAKAIEPMASPFDLFADWLADARTHELNDPNAMTLATVDSAGLPDARIVLLKEFEDPHLGFYTNFDSAKGQQLKLNPNAALIFHWKSRRRQVRVRGSVQRNSAASADAYFASRSKGSQISASVSKQSHPLADRAQLEFEAKQAEAVATDAGFIKRPDNWGGYLLTPRMFEFWQDQPYRLHDRVQYSCDSQNGAWRWIRLYP